MPTEPTPTGQPTEPTPTESPATGRADHTAEAAGGPHSEGRGSRFGDTTESKSDRKGDATESKSDRKGGAANPDGDRVAALERRVAELEAELEAVRGLLDGVEAVDEMVERRASAALATAEALEERFATEEGLVRERLPNAAGDGLRGDVEGDRPDRRPVDRRGAESDRRPERTASEARDGKVQSGNARDAGEPTGSADPPEGDSRTSTGTLGDGRASATDADQTDERAAGAGAISSVGAGAPDGQTATGGAEDGERTLAARLRDAFR